MGARRTSTGSTVSRWLTTSWSISRTRFVLDGGEAGFGIYSGLHQGGSPPMLRSLMPEQLPPPPPPPTPTHAPPKAPGPAHQQNEKNRGKGGEQRRGPESAPSARTRGATRGRHTR